jgi:NAD(P)-dependent dehydrogenase (short-subunit alcohol dehydrogenase family)
MVRYEVTGKVALVTGGARGIGLETARALGSRGASVVLVDLDAEAAGRAAAQVHESRALGIGADVTDRGAMQRAVAETVERFGGLDVVVANAGIAPRMATFRAMASESFERVLEVNLMGVYRTVDAALPEIVSRKGHIVVVSSAAAFLNGPGSAPYGMSKAAVEQFGRALRIELVQHGASASVAYFGLIDTDMVHETVDRDALAVQMFAIIPRPLLKRLPPAAAGEAIARGIEQRKPRIIRPRRWTIVSVLRGVLHPLIDAGAERDQTAQGLLRQLDARAGEDQPTTA